LYGHAVLLRHSHSDMVRITPLLSVLLHTPPPIGERSVEISVCLSLSVCVFVCPRSYLRNYAFDLHRIFFMHVTDGRGSVLLWLRSDMLRTFGFMDDVIFAHKPRLLDVAAQLKRCAVHTQHWAWL